MRSPSAGPAGQTEVRLLPLFSIPLGTCLALQLLPPDSSVPGAVTPVVWVMALGLLSGIGEDLILGGLSRAFHATNIVYLGIIAVGFVEGLQTSYSINVAAVDLQKTIIAIGLFGTAVAAGSLLPTANLPKSILRLAQCECSPRQLWRLTLTAFCLAMLTYAIPSGFSPVAMAHGLTADRWSAPWSGSYLGGWQSGYQHLAYFGYLLPALTAMIAVRNGSWLNRWAIGGLVCAVVFLLFDSQSGGRRGPVAYLGAGGLSWLVANRKCLRMTHWLGAGGLVLAVALFTDFMLKTRNIGAGNVKYEVSSFKAVQADDNLLLMTYALKAIPKEHPYVGWAAPYYFLAYPIPRALWPGKPVDMGFDLAKHVGARGVSYTMTSAGEFYIMFGWPSLIAGGMLFGWLASWWTQILQRSETVLGAMLYSLGTMALFDGVRSLIVLIEVSYPILAVLILHRCFFQQRAGAPLLQSVPEVAA